MQQLQNLCRSFIGLRQHSHTCLGYNLNGSVLGHFLSHIQYTRKITQANKTQLITILYEMLMIYVEEAESAHEKEAAKINLLPEEELV